MNLGIVIYRVKTVIKFFLGNGLIKNMNINGHACRLGALHNAALIRKIIFSFADTEYGEFGLCSPAV